MIEPALADDALLADIAAAAPRPGFRLWWLGQSGFLLQWRGRHLLLDPYLSDSLTEKYAATDRPHVRLTRRAVAPERLGFVDVATSSHNHTDHLDAQTLGPLLRANPDLRLVVPAANRAFVADRLGIAPELPTGLEVDGTMQAAGFRITAVPAAHEALSPACVGYVVRFDGRCVYHSGDTLRYDGMAERLRDERIDVALLPINGAGKGVAGNLDGLSAARLGHDIAARVVIPCHYEMFAFNTATPEEFAAECRRLGQPYRVLRCGERWSSEESASGRD